LFTETEHWEQEKLFQPGYPILWNFPLEIRDNKICTIVQLICQNSMQLKKRYSPATLEYSTKLHGSTSQKSIYLLVRS